MRYIFSQNEYVAFPPAAVFKKKFHSAVSLLTDTPLINLRKPHLASPGAKPAAVARIFAPSRTGPGRQPAREPVSSCILAPSTFGKAFQIEALAASASGFGVGIGIGEPQAAVDQLVGIVNGQTVEKFPLASSFSYLGPISTSRKAKAEAWPQSQVGMVIF